MKIKLSIVSMILIIVFSGCSFSSTTKDIDAQSLNVIKEEVITEDISNIMLDWIAGEIRLIKYNGDSIKLVEKATDNFPENKEFTFSLSGNTLTILDTNKSNLSINIVYILEVYLPDKFFNEIEVQGSSVDVTANDISAERLVVESASADFDLSGNFGDVTLSLPSGNISLECFSMPDMIDIDGSSLDVTLQLPENCGFTLNVSQATGDFSCEFPLIQKADNSWIYEDGSNIVSISLTAGDLEILKDNK